MQKLLRLLLAAWLGLLGLLAFAQVYPDKPVKIIVPFAPGGVADTSARLIAAHLSEAWNAPVLVENRPGGASIIAFSAVAKAPADGYTLLHANTNIATNASMYSNLPYDAERDFVPVALGVITPGVIVVNSAFPARSLPEFIGMAREKPGQLTYASVGVGSFPHLAMEMFDQLAGTKLTHVPYKGFAPALTALLGGQVTTLALDPSGALPHIKSGKLRALAVTAPKRLSVLPEVPTAAELGVADYDAVGWLGIMAPAGTAREVVLKLNAEINRGLVKPELAARFAATGVQTEPGSPEDFGRFIQRSRARWSSVIKTGGIKGGE